jgi:plastocyanin domain-containing protein
LAKQLVLKDAGVRKDLPLNQPVTIELTPQKAGEIRYACGMDMISGVLVVD